MSTRRYSLTGSVLAALAVVLALTIHPVSSREASPPGPARASGSPAPTAVQVSTPLPPPTYVGSDKCRECHEAASMTFDQTPMGLAFRLHPRTPLQKQDCEACHGPGSNHVDDTTVAGTLISFGSKATTAIDRQNEACLKCHESGRHTFWRGSEHERRDIGCTTCHTLHHEISYRAQLSRPTIQELCTQCHVDKWAKSWRNGHMPQREGKMECTTCHDPHGTPSDHEIKADTTNELCYKCHAETRGPFLWEHAPVRENCLTCHDAHGSIYDSMLKMRPERLCQQCHVETLHPTQPHSPFSRFVFNQSCLNCHAMVHGSNHPAGNLLLR